MAPFPRVDEALQTGIWYPYHRAINEGRYHPVQELYKTHDMFVPERYAVGNTWLTNQRRVGKHTQKVTTAAPAQVVMHRTADGTPVAVPAAGNPQAASSMVTPAVISQRVATFQPNAAQAAALQTARAKAVRRDHKVKVSSAKPQVRRKDKKAVTTVRKHQPQPVRHGHVTQPSTGRVLNPGAIRRVVRTAASVQRPLPANVKVPSTQELKGWFGSKRTTKTVKSFNSRGGNSAVLKHQALQATNARDHRMSPLQALMARFRKPVSNASGQVVAATLMRQRLMPRGGGGVSQNLNGCNWCG